MKIAIEARPIRWSYGTGIGNYTYSLIEKLDQIDTVNDYTFLWPDEEPGPLLPFRRPYTYYSLPKDDRREDTEIPLWLAQERADLFHLTQNGFRTPRPGSYKIIVTIHDLIPYFYPEMVRSTFLRRFITEMPYIVERADQIITVSEASKRDLIEIFRVDPAKIAVIPSGPSAAYRPLPGSSVAPTLQQYGLNRPFILYVGGLNPRKNVPELICAFAKIYRDLPDGQQLVILGGESRHLTQLKLLVEALDLKDEVRFPGFVDSAELPAFYNGADLFVYPSLYEGFGLPPIEAMACGTPVITSNVSSLPEVVGEAALTVNPRDTLQLAEAILEILKNEELRQSLIEKGFQQCREYQWSSIAARILAVYRKVAEHQPALSET
jgi:glycosyltransferase involved in cell wall biosynthesis